MDYSINVPDVNTDEPALLHRAEAAMRHAYAPYSGFFVGTAIRTESGGLYAACNVENVSFPIGTCAERNAIAAAVAAEGPGMRISALVLVAETAGDPAPCTPCGGCRRALVEFGPDARVYHRGGAGWRCDSAGDLLPLGFTFEPSKR